MDLASFASSHPGLCDDARLKDLGMAGPGASARELPLTAESLEAFSLDVPKDPETLPGMLKGGPEVVGWYVSFRTHPDAWGVYLRERGVKALKEEYHRIIWRDLGKYTDKPIDAIVDRIEYSLVLDYLLTHARFHYLVDYVAASREAADGRPRYVPYLEWRRSAARAPPRSPQDVVDLEEALANLEAFKNFINPGYCDSLARLVQGHIDERNAQEWAAFFVGARWGTEVANAISRQPPGFKDFTRFLNRTTSVGSYSYVRVKYSYNKDAYDAARKVISLRIDGQEPPADLSAAPDHLGAEPPAIRAFLVP